MRQTYEEAITRVFEDEGGYSNDRGDPGGPTNWGITIHDARKYWKADASANDVRHMPKSVAEEIYRKHYAEPIQYDSLPPGVDYAVLDYGINSGIGRALPVYKKVKSNDEVKTINAIYDERLRFLQNLRTWSIFGKGWASRCKRGRSLALALNKKYHVYTLDHHVGGVVSTAGTAVAMQHWYHMPWWEVGLIAAGVGLAVWLLIKWIKS